MNENFDFGASGTATTVEEFRTLGTMPERTRPSRWRWTPVLLLTLVMCALLLGGLTLVRFGQITQRPNYEPVSDKSRWTYLVEFRTMFGDVQKHKAVVRVDGKETIHGKTYHKMVTVFPSIPGVPPRVKYIRVTKEGSYAISDTRKDQPEVLSRPASLEVGTTWTVQMPDGDETTYRVEAIETVEFFDRKYEKCLKISYLGTERGFPIKGHQYHAPDVGMVKNVVDFGINTLEFTLETYEK